MSTERTPEQWLALDDLPTELAKALTPGPWKHGWVLHQDPVNNWSKCSKCDATMTGVGNNLVLPCPVPDPIKIDWNTAMKWFRKAPKTDGTIKIMHKVYRWATGGRATLDLTVLAWLLEQADAKMLLIIAAMAADRKEE